MLFFCVIKLNKKNILFLSSYFFQRHILCIYRLCLLSYINSFIEKKIKYVAEEHLAELMPIFEQLRAQGDLPCTYPLHVTSHGTAFIRGGSRSTPLSPHAPHCHPATHWVSYFIHTHTHIHSQWTHGSSFLSYCHWYLRADKFHFRFCCFLALEFLFFYYFLLSDCNVKVVTLFW